jgi:hypothetical protein
MRANSAVTRFRDALEEDADVGAAGGATVSDVPHSSQNLAVGAGSLPQDEQRRANVAPHSEQNLALGWLWCRHVPQIMRLCPRASSRDDTALAVLMS